MDRRLKDLLLFNLLVCNINMMRGVHWASNMSRNLNTNILDIYQSFSKYAPIVSKFDAPHSTAPKCALIDALLPQGGVIGIVQGVNIARPGQHKHGHEYYLGKKDDCYLLYYYDDESKWVDRDDVSNSKLHEFSYTLSGLGFRDFTGKLDANSINRWNDGNKFDEHLKSHFVRFFEGEYWQFKPNGEPSIKAVKTLDGKNVEVCNTFEILQTLQSNGHANFPDQMISYINSLQSSLIR